MNAWRFQNCICLKKPSTIVTLEGVLFPTSWLSERKKTHHQHQKNPWKAASMILLPQLLLSFSSFLGQNIWRLIKNIMNEIVFILIYTYTECFWEYFEAKVFGIKNMLFYFTSYGVYFCIVIIHLYFVECKSFYTSENSSE